MKRKHKRKEEIKVPVKEYTPAESAQVLKKQFIRQEDFFKLIGRQSEQNRQLYLVIKEHIKKDLSSKGKRLPDSKHLPLGLVLDYLADYGITREAILDNAKQFK